MVKRCLFVSNKKHTMGKLSISDEQLKTELVALFEAGISDARKCLDKIGSTYKIRIQRFYFIFNETHKYWYKIKSKVVEDSIKENAQKVMDTSFLSKIEALCILSDIARGKVIMHDDDILIPSFSDRRAAIETMCKMEGWYATAKTETKIYSDNPAILVVTTSEKIIENEEDLTDE